MYERIDFRFRCQVGINSLHATLLQYLQSKQTEFPREQMILWSLSAFWHPLACKWLGKFNEAELKQKATNAIYELQKQINYLVEIFGLETQDFAFPVTGYERNGSSNQMPITDKSSVATAPGGGLKTTTATALNSAADSKSASESELAASAVELMMSSADDELLDQAFDN